MPEVFSDSPQTSGLATFRRMAVADSELLSSRLIEKLVRQLCVAVVVSAFRHRKPTGMRRHIWCLIHVRAHRYFENQIWPRVDCGSACAVEKPRGFSIERCVIFLLVREMRETRRASAFLLTSNRQRVTFEGARTLDASGGSVFLNLLSAAESALMRAAASTHPSALCFGILTHFNCLTSHESTDQDHRALV